MRCMCRNLLCFVHACDASPRGDVGHTRVNLSVLSRICQTARWRDTIVLRASWTGLWGVGARRYSFVYGGIESGYTTDQRDARACRLASSGAAAACSIRA